MALILSHTGIQRCMNMPEAMRIAFSALSTGQAQVPQRMTVALSEQGVAMLVLPAFPYSVHYLVPQTEETPGCETMYNHDCQQRAWVRLCQVQKTEHNTCQSNSSNTAPTPLTKAMIKGVESCADEPSPAKPACQLCNRCQQETSEK